MEFSQLVKEVGLKLAILMRGDEICDNELCMLTFNQTLEIWQEAIIGSSLEEQLYKLMEIKAVEFDDFRRLWMICPRCQREKYWDIAKDNAENFDQSFDLWLLAKEEFEKKEAWDLSKSMVQNFQQALRMWRNVAPKSLEKNDAWDVVLRNTIKLEDLIYLLSISMERDRLEIHRRIILKI